MITINLEVLRKGLNYIDEEYGALMCKCAIVCFHSQNHTSEVPMKVNVTPATEFEKDGRKKVDSIFEHCKVCWTTELNSNSLRSYKDESKTTDFGAMAIALLLTLSLTTYDCFEFSEGDNGIDFWLSNEEDDLNFFGARLEVSGIRKASKNNSVRRRVKAKIEQSKQSDTTNLPVFISVTNFDKPESVYTKRTLPS